VTGAAGAVRGRGFGHGKIILIGEHGVVHGHPALAAGIARGVHAEATGGGAGRLEVPEWSLSTRAGDDTPPGRALAAILARLGATDLDFRLDAEIPSQAGLGSSAAMAVAIARAAAAAVAARSGTPAVETEQAAAVDEAESVFHGTPSGIDAAAAFGGGVGWFRRGAGWRAIPLPGPLTLCVGLSGRPRDTAAQVAAVRRLREHAPVVDKALALFDDLAEGGERALATGDAEALGRLFDVAHGILCALRVSSPELDAMVHGARAAGALGAKLTGAGGGGAVIALAPAREREVVARWRRDGFEGFVTTVGGEVPAR
jgi:mevalonate kinase